MFITCLLLRPTLARFSTSATARLSRRMQQVDVDRVDVQEDLGPLKVNLMKKAEQQNLERASKYKVLRKRDALSGLALAVFVLSIYFYSLHAVKQEDFLDDFERPDPQIEVQQQILEMQERERVEEQ